MSKANSVPKVLRVGIRRVERGWGKKRWTTLHRDPTTGKLVAFVCIEGAIIGPSPDNCRTPKTKVQEEALEMVREVIREHKDEFSIPAANDDLETTVEDALKWMKIALIRSESGGALAKDAEMVGEL